MSDQTFSLSQRTIAEIAGALEGGRIAVAELHEIVGPVPASCQCWGG